MSSITKDQLVFDPSESDNDNIGAYVRASDGTVIDKVTLTDTIDRLAVAAAMVDSDGHELDVNADGSINATVSATDLDIRDLVNTQDSVAIGDEVNIVDMQQLDSAFGATAQAFPIAGVRRDADTSPVSADADAHPLVFDDAGQLKVRANVVASVEPSDAEYAEDSPHTSGDVGLHMLSVRQDTLASSTSADGDYASLKVNALGELYTTASVSGDVADDAVDSGNPLKVGSRSTDAALTELSAAGDRADLISDIYRRIMVNSSAAIAVAQSVLAVDDTLGGTQIASTALSGRRKILIQNVGSNEVFLGASGVTAANGIELKKRTSVELELGEHVDIYAICSATETTSLRILEMA